jgi:hypothetical protein
MVDLHKTTLQFKLKQGLRADLEKLVTLYLSTQGEPLYTIDTYQLFISDGSQIRPVQSLDMAVCIDNSIVCLDNEIVFLY